MATNLENKISRVQTNVTKALAATAAKGVNVPADANSDDLESLILAIENGTASGDGREPVIATLNVTENGTYNAPVGIDGFAPVNVNVNKGVELPELDNPGSAAEIISNEANVAIYELDMALSGDSYFSAMYHNIDTLKEALQ